MLMLEIPLDCRIGFEAEFWFLSPSSGDVDDEGPDDTASWAHRRLVADYLEVFLRVPVVAPRFKKSPRRKWTVEAEYGLDPLFLSNAVLCGVEVISPPLPFSQFEKTFRTVCRFVEAHGLTDQNCGVHLNISVPSIARLDPLKLMLLSRDEILLKWFKRADHPTIRSIAAELANRAAASLSFRPDAIVEERRTQLTPLIPIGKPYSINFKRWRDGWKYVEFRQCGGQDWENKADLIVRAANEFAAALEMSCNPSASRRAYAARIRRLTRRVEAIRREGAVFPSNDNPNVARNPTPEDSKASDAHQEEEVRGTHGQWLSRRYRDYFVHRRL